MTAVRTPPLPGETPAAWSARVLDANPQWAAPAPPKQPERIRAMETIMVEPPAPVPVKKKPARPHCVYCGAEHVRRGAVCPSCADLPELELEGVDWWVQRLGWDEAVELARAFAVEDVAA